MSLMRLIDSWAEGLLRIVMGLGLAWIGIVEAGGYGLFLRVIGAIFIAAGIVEIWGGADAGQGRHEHAGVHHRRG